jgi:hypothetical protein
MAPALENNEVFLSVIFLKHLYFKNDLKIILRRFENAVALGSRLILSRSNCFCYAKFTIALHS